MNEPHHKIITLDDLEKRHIESHHQPYYDWIRHVVSLSVAALTALISLQGSYLPSSPKLPELLASCWVGLLATILLGILALRNQYNMPLAAARHLRKNREEYGDDYTVGLVKKRQYHRPPFYHRWAVRLMVLFFVFSLCSLCSFAILNLLGNKA